MANLVSRGTGIRRKRRPQNVCPNPLFAKWVEEWRDEAREKGIKSQYSYTRVWLHESSYVVAIGPARRTF